MEQLFISFLESMKEDDATLIEAILEGYDAIFEYAAHKEANIVNMFVNTKNDKTRTMAPTPWIWEGVNSSGQTEEGGSVMALDYNDAVRRTLTDIKERRIPWMLFNEIKLRRK